MGIAVLTRLLPTSGSLSCQVDDAQSLVTQISSTAKGKCHSSLTFVLQVLGYQREADSWKGAPPEAHHGYVEVPVITGTYLTPVPFGASSQGRFSVKLP